MDVTYRLDKDILYIAVEGRIDASNAPAAEEKIFSIHNHVLSGICMLHAENSLFCFSSIGSIDSAIDGNIQNIFV